MVLLTHLNTISDPRRREGRRFDLPHLLLFSLLAIISGANSYRSITRFMHVRLEWFKSLTGIDWPTAPSHTGLRKCFLKLDGNAIECALRQHATDSTHTAQIAIDGKTLRGSLDRFADQAAVQWISAFATDAKVVLGHVELSGGDKGGEIAAAQELIQTLGLTGTLFTLDAFLALPKKTLNLIEDTGNDALIQVKRNQPTLFDTLTGWAQAEPAAQTHRTIDIGRRNRIASRQATVWQLPLGIPASLAEWPRMCCLVRIERSTE